MMVVVSAVISPIPAVISAVAIVISIAFAMVIVMMMLVMVAVTCHEVEIQIISWSETKTNRILLANSFRQHTHKSFKDSSKNLTFFTWCGVDTSDDGEDNQQNAQTQLWWKVNKKLVS